MAESRPRAALRRLYAPVAGDDEHKEAERAQPEGDEAEQVGPEGLGGKGREGTAEAAGLLGVELERGLGEKAAYDEEDHAPGGVTEAAGARGPTASRGGPSRRA